MKELNQYGTALRTYEGMGTASFSDGRTVSVYFECRQITSGEIVVGCMASIEQSLHGEVERIEGVTTGGEHFATGKQIERIYDGMVQRPPVLHFTCDTVYIYDPRRVAFCPVTALEVALVNLIVDPQELNAIPAPTMMRFGGYRIDISFLEDYQRRYEFLSRARGILQTATATIVPEENQALEHEDIMRILDQLCTPLSLATSNKVTWLWYTSKFDENTPLATTHGSMITRPFTNGGIAFDLSTNIIPIVAAYNADIDFVIDKEEVRSGIHQYLDACSESVFFETQSLSAATLLDNLANRYAVATDRAVVLDESIWTYYITPQLEKTLEEILETFPSTSDKPDVEHATISRIDAIEAVRKLDRNSRDALASKLRGLWRRSFRSRLNRMLKDLNIKCAFLNEVKSSRDALVHEGRFHAIDKDQQRRENAQLLWVSYAVLLRLITKDAVIPHFERLEGWFTN